MKKNHRRQSISAAEIAERNARALRYADQVADLDPSLAAAIRADPAQGCFACVWSEQGQYLVRCLAHGGDEDPQERPVH